MSANEKSEAQAKVPLNLKAVPAEATMTKVGDGFAPKAPEHVNDTGIEPEVLSDLALKLAYTVPHFTTEKASKQL